jgi:hypothetical protein
VVTHVSEEDTSCNFMVEVKAVCSFEECVLTYCVTTQKITILIFPTVTISELTYFVKFHSYHYVTLKIN